MKTIKQIIELANTALNEALACAGDPSLFSIVPGESLNGEPSENDPYVSIEYDIIIKFGTIERKHALVIGWNGEQLGIEYNEDGDLEPITYGNLFKQLYFNLVVEGFANEL